MYEISTAWQQVSAVGAEYRKIVDLVPFGEGKIYAEGEFKDLDARTPQQWELSEQLVNTVRPYISQLVRTLRSGRTIKTRVEGKHRIIRIGDVRALYTQEELENEAVIGLIRSMHNYKPDFSFSTFVHHGTAWSLHRFVNYNSSSLVKVCGNTRTKIYKHKRETGKTLQSSIQDELDITADRAGLIALGINGKYVSIDCLCESGGTQYNQEQNLYNNIVRQRVPEVLLQDNTQNTYRSVDYALLQENLDAVLGTLTEREKKVIELRFGFHDGIERDLESVGSVFNVTRERIRQIESKGLRKLRLPKNTRRLETLVEDRVQPWELEIEFCSQSQAKYDFASLAIADQVQYYLLHKPRFNVPILDALQNEIVDDKDIDSHVRLVLMQKAITKEWNKCLRLNTRIGRVKDDMGDYITELLFEISYNPYAELHCAPVIKMENSSQGDIHMAPLLLQKNIGKHKKFSFSIGNHTFPSSHLKEAYAEYGF